MHFCSRGFHAAYYSPCRNSFLVDALKRTVCIHTPIFPPWALSPCWEVAQHMYAHIMLNYLVPYLWLRRIRSTFECSGLLSRKIDWKSAPVVVNSNFGDLVLGATATDLDDSCCI